MNTKNRLLTVAGAVSLLAASNVFAFDGTITIASSPFEFGTGGEFMAAEVTGPPGIGAFNTFCLELGEHLSANGSVYSFNLNSGAVTGGAGATTVDSSVPPHTGLPMDPVSLGVAWLYSQFRAGTLQAPGGGGTYFDGSRLANAGVLQDAIWMLEGEKTIAANGYVTQATTFAGSLANAQANANGAFGVIALNLFNGQNSITATNAAGVVFNVNQDVLAIVPEPSTMIAGALLMLPLGASALRIIRKNRTA